MSPDERFPGDERARSVNSCWARWSSWRDDPERMKLVSRAERDVIERRINRRVSGDEEVYRVDRAAASFMGGRAELGLSPGCGSGYLERYVIDRGYAPAMEGVDVSGEALEHARGASGERRITCRRVDLDRDSLKEGMYDFAISTAALHHATSLGNCIAQIHRSLKDDGIMITNEFVGPDRFQWPTNSPPSSTG